MWGEAAPVSRHAGTRSASAAGDAEPRDPRHDAGGALGEVDPVPPLAARRTSRIAGPRRVEEGEERDGGARLRQLAGHLPRDLPADRVAADPVRTRRLAR